MRLGLSGPAIIATLGLSGLAVADELQPLDSSREVRLRQLETRVRELEAQEASSLADKAATIEAILRDAERRSTFLANSEEASAGYDDGFYIRSGSFEFRPSIFTIFRNTTSWVDHPLNPNREEGFDNGFELRRVELEFEGTVFSPQLWYDFVWKVPSNGGEPVLDEAFATYGFADTPWALKAGQFKDHVYQEETVSSKRQLAAERSILNELLMGGCFDRVQGVAVLYGDLNTPLHAEGSFHDGAASFNTPFTDTPTDSAANAHFGITGRLDWKIMGDWKNYRNFSAR
ncbi:MAG: porin, partial [Bacillota bacterium]